MKRDHGKVEMFPVPDSPSQPTAGTEGPSIPDPVVHPLPAAALSTNPIAASLESGERERRRSLRTGRRLALELSLLISMELDWEFESWSSSRLEDKRKWRDLGERENLLVEGKMEKGEEGDGRVAEEGVAKVSMNATKHNKTKQPRLLFSFLFSFLFLLFFL